MPDSDQQDTSQDYAARASAAGFQQQGSGAIGSGIATALGIIGQGAGEIPGAPARTILSGVERAQKLAQVATPILTEFAELVAVMSGKPPNSSATLTGTGSTSPGGTPSQLHDAVSFLESFVSQVGALVKSAHAAHG